MKIIVFLALAFVSVCSESSGQASNGGNTQPNSPTFRCDSPYINNYANDKSCLKHALEAVSKLEISGNRLICKHYFGQMNQRFEFYQDFTAETTAFMKCAGCVGGGMLGLENLAGATGAAAGAAFAEIFPIIAETIHGIKLAEPVLDFMCILLNNSLTAECLKAITDNVNLLLDDLKDLSCQKRLNKINPKTLFAIVNNSACMGDKLLNTDGILEQLTDAVGKAIAPVLSLVADTVLNVPLVRSLLGTVNCILNTLLGGILGVKI
ncbi:uncharacterized protein ACNLHF_027352 [Anomaloglossus baeobatrachus]|uniref:uncharacterized protein LOC142249543 n=1 Tax=Anomaloglossus baeobatrachus TaxID=238106 RepID=UPI003F505756